MATDEKELRKLQHSEGSPSSRKHFGIRFVTKEMREHITAAETLKQQTGLSLANRCEAINNRYGFPRMNPTLLRRIYGEHGVKKKAIHLKKVVTPELQAELP